RYSAASAPAGMVNEIRRTSRGKRNKRILSATRGIRHGEPESRAVVGVFFRSRAILSAGRMPAGALSRHLCHSLAIEPNLADAFYPCEDVIHSLTADSHQFRPHNSRHKIARKIQDLLRRRTIEPLAKNGRHSASKRLHFRTEGHPNVCLA